MNLNQIAKEITLVEEGKISLPIGQVKEVLRILFSEYSLQEVVQMWLKKNKVKV